MNTQDPTQAPATQPEEKLSEGTAKWAVTQLHDKLDEANRQAEIDRNRIDKLLDATDRLKDALGFLAEKLQKETPGHPRHGLFSSVMRILDGKPVDPEPAQPEPATEPVTQTTGE